MKAYMVRRVLEIAHYVLETGATVRQAGKQFAVSKSTAHKDLQQRLKLIDPQLAHRVSKVLDLNLEERHLRGGNATRKKYLMLKNR